MCFELGPHGFRCDWGRVLAWEPPGRLVLAWQIGPTRVPKPDPAKASEVEVRFERDGHATRASLSHTGFERHGEGRGLRRGDGLRPGGDYILARFADRL